jgi:hypothetical protein
MSVYNLRQFGRAAAVTKSDTAEIPSVSGGFNEGCCLYIGGAGDVKVKTVGGDIVIFKAVPVGTTLQVKVLQVFSTDTTATNIVALW